MNDMMLLIEPLIPPLRRYARALVKDHATADDLVQDCLERAITRWHQRRQDGDARTWLFTILHNLAVSHMRQNRRRGSHVTLDDGVDEAMIARPATQEDALHHADVMQALQTLPEDQRSVLLLVSVEDLTYAEAARVLDIPIGTVMSRLARAREKLLQKMEGAPAQEAAKGGATIHRPAFGAGIFRRVK
ncbi:sigma-70 family RNA polymerase sigma factor [Nitrospirillum viridazoti]|uniref:RNA polymerase sigma-70 factor (ECF subfamily) n=1 Tax=Nitrospirillum amazonense TaxID=28077 RepID=A0A560IW63_9PROT|nr:sigma-70 family RNA polymerase sigma factor [Nitrospirillum amazonense]TWB63288.1 RNA polymerase sigma-70 factor (ECF subfamily) [Nitrospirillum amazonense]